MALYIAKQYQRQAEWAVTFYFIVFINLVVVVEGWQGVDSSCRCVIEVTAIYYVNTSYSVSCANLR